MMLGRFRRLTRTSSRSRAQAEAHERSLAGGNASVENDVIWAQVLELGEETTNIDSFEDAPADNNPERLGRYFIQCLA